MSDCLSNILEVFWDYIAPIIDRTYGYPIRSVHQMVQHGNTLVRGIPC